MPPRPIRVLLVEDSDDDAELTLRALKSAGFAPDFERVESEAEMMTALARSTWDIVLCDYALPAFNAPAALRLVSGLGYDVPFVVVSGTVGEDAAIEVMRVGAHDYLFKDRLQRLGAVVERELESVVARRAHRAMQESLRLSEIRHRLLVEQSSDVVVIIDRDGRFSYVSPGADRLLGYPPDELAGREVTSIVHEESAATARDVLAKAMDQPGLTLTVGLVLQRKDGGRRHVEGIITNRFENPAVNGVIATFRDVSQRKAIEEERHARVRAELANKTKSRLLANMSHELRTPLNAIIGFSELMEQGLAGSLSERQSSYVGNVLQAGRHLLTLVNDILDLSKVEAGKLALVREWTELSDATRTLESTLRPLARTRDIALEILVPPRLPQLYVDGVRLKQILYNLVSNAIKFTPAGGTVRVVAVQRDRRLELRVEDTGIGIREEDLPRLFEDFEQLEPHGMAEKPEGTGLGLALTKRLVEMHGGTIQVKSQLGAGSTFTVTFPDVLKPTRHSEGPPSFASRAASTVLVVEDDDVAAELLAGHLRSLGIEPLFARTALDALHMAAQRQPAAITLEVLIPRIDGWALIGCLKEDPMTAQIPIVVVSVNDDRARSREVGAAAHLIKPVTGAALQETFERLGVRTRQQPVERRPVP